MDYTICSDLTPAETERIGEQLDAFNARQTGFNDERTLHLAARGLDNQLLGGLTGVTGNQWLYIHILWVAEDHRQTGIGAALYRAAEDAAIERGCLSACLMTFSYQAYDFYSKRGYIAFGQLEDYPVGHTLYFMKKRLTPASQERPSAPHDQ